MSTWKSTEINKSVAKQINNNEEYRLNDQLRHDDLNVIVQTLLDLIEEDEITNNCLWMVQNEAVRNRIIGSQGLEVELNNSGNTLNSVEIKFNCRNLPLYLVVTPSEENKVEESYYLSFNINSDIEENTITLIISETNCIRDTTDLEERVIPYRLDFYADEEQTNLFSTLEGTVKYSYLSEEAEGD